MQQYELNMGDIKEVKKKVTPAESNKRYRENNKEKIAEARKLYRENNKEKIAEVMKLYYENNKEKITEARKLYIKNNKEKVAARYKLYYENNRERKNKTNRRWYEKTTEVSSYDDIDISWARVKLHKIKGSLKKRSHLNLSVTLTAEDIIGLVPKDLTCPVYKELFIFKGSSQWNLSFDRIDNNKGYTKDNVVVVSNRVNRIKSVANVKELYQVADFYYELEKKRLDK